MQFIKKKEEPEIDQEAVTAVCIDDFVLKKRQRYGTLMVDIGTGSIIDMIASREPADVAQWLAGYPNIQVVSRDGAFNYAAAITEAHPNAIQVSDRFHLIKNRNERATEVFHRLFSGRVVIPITEKTADREIKLETGKKGDKIKDCTGNAR
jgi:transposase